MDYKCPKCGSGALVKSGKKGSVQNYQCKSCKKYTLETILNPTGKTEKREILQDFSEATGSITVKSLDVRTVEDALKIAAVDLNIWEIERHIVNSWEVTMGANKTGTGQPETYTNWQVKVWLKRAVTPLQEKIAELITERLANYTAPKLKRLTAAKIKKYMLEISLYDHHFGMLSWSAETGQDWDLKIAENLYLNAVTDILGKVNPAEIECILFPIGQDFFHVNNAMNITPKGGNILDADSRLAKIFSVGETSVIKAIDLCRQVAPVKVIWVPGNHDPQTSYYLVKVLSAWYRSVKDVNVDCSPTTRKYELYGVNLIGFTHGDEEPHRDLPRLMADEVPRLWAKSKFREFHTGHLHKAKELSFVTTDSFGATKVRILPSLARPDAWHYKKGYVGNTYSSQAFLWHKQKGFSTFIMTYQ